MKIKLYSGQTLIHTYSGDETPRIGEYISLHRYADGEIISLYKVTAIHRKVMCSELNSREAEICVGAELIC